MRPETIFQVINLGVVPAWALLVFAPRWRWTQTVVHSGVLPLLLTSAWGVTLAISKAPPGAGGTTLSAAMLLFDDPWLAVACWAHYIVGDLFVGAWIARDAVRRKVSAWLVAPILLATMMMMPLGLALYIVLRALTRRTMTLEESRVVTA